MSTEQFQSWTQCLIWIRNIYVEEYLTRSRGMVEKYPAWLQDADFRQDYKFFILWWMLTNPIGSHPQK